MLDIQFIRDNAELVKQNAKNKNQNPAVVDNLLEVDLKRRELIGKVENIRAERNGLNNELKKARTDELINQSKTLKTQLESLEPELRQAEEAFADLMLQVPNVTLPEVPVGKDSTGNVVVREWGKKPTFKFTPLDHVALGTKNGWLDLERGSKVAGFRGYFLQGEAALLQIKLMQYALNKFVAKGYTPLIPPVIDTRQAFINTGHLPWGEKETYKLAEDETDPKNDYFLAGTAEIPLVSYYAGETLREKDLPIKLVGFSPCFRREVGSYGKDTKGIFRVHEFWKIEQVVLCQNDLAESKSWHEKMLGFTEEILQDFGIPYRVLLMCTGDMGEPQAKKYDIEAWMPGRGDYGEVASDSIMTDFQSRRANIKYLASDGTVKYVHMLNNTALASTRTLIALWENFQQKDGSVKLPKCLT
ncbi:MAG: Serine-tRNA ligase [Microgenomates group bacterium GW2011_GWC1_46_16]|uniref:Serine--tRNA ligase n=2 Tax=Candidatus Collieribacteriota TaxID=1752725 RepID=A0A1F5FZR9_9BACT|nr:MAG: Seryl-tRNA synthetase [Microgenomates group bacterium GW2011_GWF1_46_12]KKU25647.1 MAG: Serine-tRNA ligase [Microgenomates group bacterium GW2011_GWC1_46_16]KKU27609.1 MAG: Seryl-tRNA synthetase [Microgenomates group bacterium GW2011_GWF2_46_18]KKU43658.1 MAG: Seryl-tRNA synthetase [Microgenomates group bacterium GW2011_GWA1_46_7]KKU44774.1 MAG: Seryl-tRNA synthetase [Microgenomates group bacterium GW2011_GWB1_46_7]KKU60193.1 MAG: Seryl-tRNA synthetase [Microgenomates group bacterium G